MEKPKKIFIPSAGRALVAGEARRKRPRFVLTWWGRQTKKLKFRRSRQVLGKGAFMKKTKINFIPSMASPFLLKRGRKPTGDFVLT